MDTRATDIEVGKYLALLRDDAELKQSELAGLVGLAPSVLSRIESGERHATFEEVDSILESIRTQEAMTFKTTIRREWHKISRPPFGHPDEVILWCGEEVLKSLDILLENPDIRNSFATSVNELKQEIQKAARLVQITEHSIAFVGSIGIGKSTAICRVSGLEIPNSNLGVPDTVLQVGGGGVTICEVHLVQGPDYGLLIEPMSDEEIRREVREFAIIQKSPPKTNEDDGADPPIGTSREIERAIRNMSDLQTIRTNELDPDGKRVRRTEDLAKRLADECPDIGVFCVEILNKMNLAGRTRRELWHSSDGFASDPLVWLRESFQSLNIGKHPEFSIPKRIEVIVPEPVLGEKSVSIRLVDTRGIGPMAERADIMSLFSEPNTIVLLCSSFNDAPAAAVQSILTRAKNERIGTIEDKTSVLVFPRDREALAVIDDAGEPAETTEDGYDMKRDQADTMLQSIGVGGIRVEFFNAFGDDSDNLKSLLMEFVDRLRSRHREELEELIKDGYNLVENFDREQTLTVQRTAARRLKVWLEHDAQLDFSNFPGVERSLLEVMDISYASTVRASIRRQGDWYNLDYSDQLGYGAKLLAAGVVATKQDSFRAIAQNLLNDEELTEAFGLVRQALRVIDSGVEAILTKSQIEGIEIHSREMKPDRTLWSRCDNEWGRGGGYRDRVVKHNREWFKDGTKQVTTYYNGNRDHQQDFRDLIEREWTATLKHLSDRLDEVLEE